MRVGEYLWYQVPSGGGYVKGDGGYVQGMRHGPGAVRTPQIPSPSDGQHIYSRQVAGTHLTGMHSCLYKTTPLCHS